LYRERRVRPASEGSSGRDQELTSEAQSPLDHAQLPKEDGDRDPERNHRRENEEAAVREPYWLPLSPQSRLRIRRTAGFVRTASLNSRSAGVIGWNLPRSRPCKTLMFILGREYPRRIIESTTSLIGNGSPNAPFDIGSSASLTMNLSTPRILGATLFSGRSGRASRRNWPSRLEMNSSTFSSCRIRARRAGPP